MAVRQKDWRLTPDKWTRGERNAAWIEQFCRGPEGRDRGKPVRLRDWQVVELRKIYDTPTRTASLPHGRKNGKTALIAFIGLLHLCGPEAGLARRWVRRLAVVGCLGAGRRWCFGTPASVLACVPRCRS